jgi:hypothetical protein
MKSEAILGFQIVLITLIFVTGVFVALMNIASEWNKEQLETRTCNLFGLFIAGCVILFTSCFL